MAITEKWIIATDAEMKKMWKKKDEGDNHYNEIKLILKYSNPSQEFLQEMFLKKDENFWLLEIDDSKVNQSKFMYLKDLKEVQ